MSTRDSEHLRSRFNADSPRDQMDLERAWDILESELQDGNTAAVLGDGELDHLIADLVCVRHRRLPGDHVGSTLRTVITQRNQSTELDTYVENPLKDGIELEPGDDPS